jgi:hypothetical protein
MTVKDIIQQIEHKFGRQPEAYCKRLINDALLDMSEKIQHYEVNAKEDLTQNKKWYALPNKLIEITRVDILDTDSRYVMIPKLLDGHLLSKDDTDDSGTGDYSG